jgi:hypothetical protein
LDTRILGINKLIQTQLIKGEKLLVTGMSHLFDVPITSELVSLVKTISNGSVPVKVQCHRQVVILYITYSDDSTAILNVWIGATMGDKTFKALHELIAH